MMLPNEDQLKLEATLQAVTGDARLLTKGWRVSDDDKTVHCTLFAHGAMRGFEIALADVGDADAVKAALTAANYYAVPMDAPHSGLRADVGAGEPMLAVSKDGVAVYVPTHLDPHTVLSPEAREQIRQKIESGELGRDKVEKAIAASHAFTSHSYSIDSDPADAPTPTASDVADAIYTSTNPGATWTTLPDPDEDTQPSDPAPADDENVIKGTASIEDSLIAARVAAERDLPTSDLVDEWLAYAETEWRADRVPLSPLDWHEQNKGDAGDAESEAKPTSKRGRKPKGAK